MRHTETGSGLQALRPASEDVNGVDAPKSGPSLLNTQDELPADIRLEAQSVITEYRALERRTLEGFAAIGRRLIGIRHKLEHGLFLKWIRNDLGVSIATAYRMIALAENLGDELLTVRNLPPSVVYELAAPTTPVTVRSEIITRLKAGQDIASDEIIRQVKDAREAARRSKAPVKENGTSLKARKPKIDVKAQLEAHRPRIEEALANRAEKTCPEPLSYTAKLLGVDVRTVKAVAQPPKQAEVEEAIRNEPTAAAVPPNAGVSTTITIESIKGEFIQFSDEELEDLRLAIETEQASRRRIAAAAAKETYPELPSCLDRRSSKSSEVAP